MHQQLQPWRKRQEVPEPQVRDAAERYEAARELLAAQTPGSGLLVPLMNAVAVAIELNLKYVAAEKEYTAANDGGFVASADPAMKGHYLTGLLDMIRR